jgi:hypothetical protein
MNLLEKYQIDFIDLPVGFAVLMNMKLHLIKSILSIELNYCRNIRTYVRIVFSAILISLLIMPIDIIGKFPLMILLFSLNSDLIYILVHIHSPYVDLNEKDGLKILVDDKNNKFVIQYNDRLLGYLTKIKLPPLLFIPLLREYVNNENLPDYKKQFITNNLEFSLEGNDDVNQKELVS